MPIQESDNSLPYNEIWQKLVDLKRLPHDDVVTGLLVDALITYRRERDYLTAFISHKRYSCLDRLLNLIDGCRDGDTNVIDLLDQVVVITTEIENEFQNIKSRTSIMLVCLMDFEIKVRRNTENITAELRNQIRECRSNIVELKNQLDINRATINAQIQLIHKYNASSSNVQALLANSNIIIQEYKRKIEDLSNANESLTVTLESITKAKNQSEEMLKDFQRNPIPSFRK